MYVWLETVIFLLEQAIADACKIPSSITFVSDLTEGEVPEVSEHCFTEDQELEQLIHGKICFKVFPFSSGKVQYAFSLLYIDWNFVFC